MSKSEFSTAFDVAATVRNLSCSEPTAVFALSRRPSSQELSIFPYCVPEANWFSVFFRLRVATRFPHRWLHSHFWNSSQAWAWLPYGPIML